MEPLILPTEGIGLAAYKGDQQFLMENVQPQVGYAMRKAASAAFEYTPTAAAVTADALNLTETSYGQIPTNEIPARKLSPKELTERYGSDVVRWDQEYTEDQADFLYKRKQRQLENIDRQERTRGLSNAAVLGAELAAAASDPLSLITGMGIQPFSLARPMAEVGTGSAFQGIHRLRILAQQPANYTEALFVSGQITGKGIAARAGLAAGDNLIAGAVLEGYNLPAQQQLQMDYTAADAMMNIVAGGIFGGAIGTATGFYNKLVPDWAKRAAPTFEQHQANILRGIIQTTNGQRVDIPLISGADQVSREAGPEMTYRPKEEARSRKARRQRENELNEVDVPEHAFGENTSRFEIEEPDIPEHAYLDVDVGNVPVRVKDPVDGAIHSLAGEEVGLKVDVILPKESSLWKEGAKLTEQSKEVQEAIAKHLEDYYHLYDLNDVPRNKETGHVELKDHHGVWLKNKVEEGGGTWDDFIEDLGIKGKVDEEGPVIFDPKDIDVLPAKRAGDIEIEEPDIPEHAFEDATIEEPDVLEQPYTRADDLYEDQAKDFANYRDVEDVKDLGDYEADVEAMSDYDASLEAMAKLDEAEASLLSAHQPGFEPIDVMTIRKVYDDELRMYRHWEAEQRGVDLVKEHSEMLEAAKGLEEADKAATTLVEHMGEEGIENAEVKAQIAEKTAYEENMAKIREILREAGNCLIRNGH